MAFPHIGTRRAFERCERVRFRSRAAPTRCKNLDPGRGRAAQAGSSRVDFGLSPTTRVPLIFAGLKSSCCQWDGNDRLPLRPIQQSN
jgi:hypothetical protein